MSKRDVPEAEATSPGGGPTDQSLISRFQRGQGDAATAIYLRYAHRLQALVQSQKGTELQGRIDDEDIVQSVFRTFFRRAASGQFAVPDGDELWKLFLVIALHKTRAVGEYNRAAKRAVKRTASDVDLDRVADLESYRDQSALSVLHLVIDDVLARLPASQRRIIELRVEGYEVAEIAAQANRAKRSVERVLQEFQNKLHAEIACG